MNQQQHLVPNNNTTTSSSSAAVVVGCGVVCLDYFSVFATYPEANSKVRATQPLVVDVGGNCSNVLQILSCPLFQHTPTRLISKICNDLIGNQILHILKQTPVMDLKYLSIQDVTIQSSSTTSYHHDNSPFTYIIVDEKSKTRTCLHTRMNNTFVLQDYMDSIAQTASATEPATSVLQDAGMIYLDGRYLAVGMELIKEAKKKRVPVFLECERLRPGIDEEIADAIAEAQYIVCSESFPTEFVAFQHKRNQQMPSIIMTAAEEEGEGEQNKTVELGAVMASLFEMMRHKVDNSFVIVTLGSAGSILLTDYNSNAASAILSSSSQCTISANPSVQAFITYSQQQIQQLSLTSSSSMAPVLLGSVEYHHPETQKQIAASKYLCIYCGVWPSKKEDIVDTTCAGDTFIATCIYSLLQMGASEKSNNHNGLLMLTHMMQLASYTAYVNCTAIGKKAILNISASELQRVLQFLHQKATC